MWSGGARPSRNKGNLKSPSTDLEPKSYYLNGIFRVDYAFTATEKDGAILILPDGAILSELMDKGQLEKIREHVARCALRWCRFANKDSLYLLTAMYKSKSWTLGSFYDAPNENEIVVYRPCDSASVSMYKWDYKSNVDDQQGPKNNSYHNQTVLIKGFKVTVRWDWLPIVQQVEMTEWWLVCFFTSLWRWLSRIRGWSLLLPCSTYQCKLYIGIDNIPTHCFSQVCPVTHYYMCRDKLSFSLITLWIQLIMSSWTRFAQ